jgi:hypothetical protein
MQFILILILGVVFPLAHILNAKLFAFAVITPHIGLIYLPAFFRLFNVLILKPRDGTLATLLGGVLLMRVFDNSTLVELLNIACSTGGPLIALYLFKLYKKREVKLTSPQDLALLTFIYAPANALLHHVMWSQLDPSQLEAPIQVLWMIVGDIAGTLIGAYTLIFVVRLYRAIRHGGV